MKVSVLVPVYGVERYIAKCAVSLFNQTYEDIEYIFVDDCTPDHSIDVLQEVLHQYPLRQQQVTILHHEQNKGLGAARLTALQAAAGDYVMHVDSDDELPLNAVALLAAKAVETNSDIIDGGYAMMCHEKLISKHLPYAGTHQQYLKLLLCQNILFSMVWARLYRRTIYTERQILPVPGIDYAEDLGLIPRLVFYASRSVVNAVVYYYRDDNATSYTNAVLSDKAKRSFLRANALVHDFYRQNDTQGLYDYALQQGYIHVLRMARRNGIPMQMVDEQCPYKLTNEAVKFVATLMRSNCPLGIASLLYRCLRKIYEFKVRMFS